MMFEAIMKSAAPMIEKFKKEASDRAERAEKKLDDIIARLDRLEKALCQNKKTEDSSTAQHGNGD